MSVEARSVTKPAPSPTHTWRRRVSRTGVAVLACLILLGVTRNMWLSWLYTFLDTSEDPKGADFIVVLGGGAGTRTTTGAALYHKGYAPRLVMSGCYPSLGEHLSTLKESGVPAEAIIVLNDVYSTWTEAEEVLKILRHEGARSAIIVTDGFHIRRTKATYEHLQSESGIELVYVATSGPFVADSWWHQPSGPRLILNEYIKLVYYLLRYGVWPL
jgi:uncharacterized SAM-binding protein YcdF (DUF218 family)